MHETRFIQLHVPDAAQLAAEAVQGLQASQAHASPKFFYDPLGSRLFDAITQLDEYYPTRTEAAILSAYAAAIADAVHGAVGAGATMVDLGAGSCEKAARLLGPFQLARYVAVDISIDFLHQALVQLQGRHPAVQTVGLGLDFSSRLTLPAGLVESPALVFYPGSSIGNFAPPAAVQLLRQARDISAGGALLIGVDLLKPAAVLEPAYDDALGVTAAFNLNLLRHLNRLVGSNFDLRQWQHVAFFNADADVSAGRVEMHLQARQALSVQWPGGERHFAAGERIHTENAYKWTRPHFEALLHEAGFGRVQTWTDPQGWFAVMLAQAA